MKGNELYNDHKAKTKFNKKTKSIKREIYKNATLASKL